MSTTPFTRIPLRILGLAAVALSAAHPAVAQSAAVTGLDNASYADQTGNYSIGFSFTVGSQPVIVTALGYLDDGFGSTHDIGIYDSSGGLVAFADATAGADGNTARSSASAPTFTYTDLTAPVSLVSGDIYSIVAGNYTGGVYLANGTPVTDSRITYDGSLQSAVNNSDAFQPPPYTTSTIGGDFGPNFLIAPAAVSAAPEPSQIGMIALISIGVGGLLLRARRQRALD
jgi:hypothetical protein